MASDFGIGCTAICCASVAALLTISAGSNFLAVVINLPRTVSTKSPECWACDPNVRAVRIELSSEQSLLLPFDQFAFAELKNDGKEQRLRLVFATHEVSLRGHSLRRIETAMQRMEISFLGKLPCGQRALITEGQPVVVEMIVTETQLQQHGAENASESLQ